jgi:hypothetical protein
MKSPRQKNSACSHFKLFGPPVPSVSTVGFSSAAASLQLAGPVAYMPSCQSAPVRHLQHGV